MEIIKNHKDLVALVMKACICKGHLSFRKLCFLGILGGMYIGFGAELSIRIAGDVWDGVGFGFTQWIKGSVFVLGLFLVMSMGAELFTGNILMLFSVWGRQLSWSKMFRNWIIVYWCNFLGAVVLAFLILETNLWKTFNFYDAVATVKIASSKVNLSIAESFVRGILANWLVCLGVFGGFAGRNLPEKLLGMYFPIMAFVALGYEHSIANMFFVSKGIMLLDREGFVETLHMLKTTVSPHLTWFGFLTRNLLWVTFGNIVGAGVFVAFFYHQAYKES